MVECCLPHGGKKKQQQKKKKTTQQHGMTENERDKLGKIVSTEAFGTALSKTRLHLA